jgi:hypothetical protein
MTAGIRVGIDFDNTIVTYDDVFSDAAAAFAGIAPGVGRQKRDIRDYLRTLPDGELTWQRLQGHVYGKGISGARMFEGVDRFLRRCRAENAEIVIVSHKTEFGHHDPERVNLRDAARGWMAQQGFFRDDGFGIPATNLFFETTRVEKLRRIASLNLNCFIDDLEEVLDDPDFPESVTRILFSQAALPAHRPLYAVCRSWDEIEKLVFRD